MSDWLQPWEPTAQDPFDLQQAGHLLRRAGFGGSLAQRRALVHGGVDAAVHGLCEPAPGPDPAAQWLEPLLALNEIERVRAARVWLALQGQRPLQTRMSVFWHGHFATSNKKLLDPRALALQFATFDRLGLGPFDALAQAMVRDPALLRWLDNDVNVAGRPNENFAREWFELFTLGRGNYGEPDVQAAARAFTGFHVVRGQFAFVGREHDGGDKELLGARGTFDGGDVARLSVGHPASARFLAHKWLRCFVHPEPESAWVDELAACYAQNERHVGRTLAVLLRSRLFFDAQNRRSMVKSPGDFVIGTVRACGGRAVPKLLGEAMAAMGEAWGEPPTVEGWHGDRAWLSPASWLLRSNFAAELFAGRRGAFAPDAEALLAPAKGAQERGALALELLLDGDVSAQSRERLCAFAASAAGQGQGGASALLHAATALPEYQLL